jgi:hypothetical protein
MTRHFTPVALRLAFALVALVALAAGDAGARSLDPFLVGYWPGVLNEDDALQDFSRQGNDGTVTGCTYVATPRGAGLAFSADNVNCGSGAGNMGTGDFSIAFLVRLEDVAAEQWIMGKADNNPANAGATGFDIVYLQSINGTRLRINDGTGGAASVDLTGVDIADNVWHYVALVADRDSNAQWYVDGIAYENSSISGETSSITTATNFYLGANRSGANGMTGSLSDLRIYNTALTSAEVERPARAPSRTSLYQRTDGRYYPRFNGSSDYFKRSVANWRSGDSQGTVCGWFKCFDSSATFNTILASGDEAGGWEYYIAAYIYNDHLTFYQKNSDTADWIEGTTSVADGSWHFFAISTNGSRFLMRLDDASETFTVEGGSDNGNWFADTANRDNITIGASITNVVSAYYNGLLSEIRQYSSEKSLAQLQAIQAGTDDVTDLVGYWPLDERDGLDALSVHAGGTMSAPAVANSPDRVRFPEMSTGAKPMWVCDFRDGKMSGFTVVSGAFQPIYIDSLGLWGIECTSSGVISIPVPLELQTLGNANFRYQWWHNKSAGGTQTIGFISGNPTMVASGYSYEFHAAEIFRLREYNSAGGIVTNHAQSATPLAGYTPGTWYLSRVDHTRAGAFTGYIGANEAGLAEINLAGGSGSWPVTDVTHTSSYYQVYDIDTGDIILDHTISVY